MLTFREVQAIEELNIKPKFWKDLLTDEPFSRKDIIHLQDPMNLSARNMQQFDHVKRNLKLIDEEEEAKLRVRCRTPRPLPRRTLPLCALRIRIRSVRRMWGGRPSCSDPIPPVARLAEIRPRDPCCPSSRLG